MEEQQLTDFTACSRHRGFKAEAIAAYVRSTANLPFDFSRPIDKAKLLSTVTIALAVLSAIWRARPYLKYIVSSTYLWSAGTVVRSLLSPASIHLLTFRLHYTRSSSFS